MRMCLVWAWLIVYFGIGVMGGAVILSWAGDLDLALATGGGLVLGGITLRFYMSWSGRHKEDTLGEGQ